MLKALWQSPASGRRGNRLKEVAVEGWVIDIRQFHQCFPDMGKVLPHGSPRTVAIFGTQGGQDLLMVFEPVLAVPGIKDTVVQFGPHRALVPFAPQLVDHVHQYRILRCLSNQPVKSSSPE